MIFLKEILMKWHNLIIFTAVLAFLSLLITLSFYEVTYDDVYLAFRYAKNLVGGYGFVFNPGENFLGTPAPFFVISLALLHKLLPMLSIPQIASWISGFSLFFCSLFAYLVARDLHQPLVGSLVALFTLLNPLVLMTFGGETPFYLMLVCAAFYFYFKGQIYIPSFLLALSLLNRSEGIVPAAVIFGHFLLVKRRVPLGPMTLYILTIAPWLAFSLLKFGSPLTNSLAAKIAQVEVGLPLFLQGAINWVRLIIGGNLFFAAFIPLFVLGMIYAIVGERQWLLLFSWVILQTIGYIILRVPFYHWYVAHIGLGLGILASLGAAAPPYFWGTVYKVMDDLLVAIKEDAVALRHKLSSLSDKLKVLYPLVVSLVSLCVILSLLAEIGAIYPYYRGQPGPANRLYRAAGEWFAENTDQDASIAYLEIGQIGYYSDRRVIDVLGLVTPGVVDHVKKGDFLWAYLRYKPDYIVYNAIFSAWIGVVRQQPWFKDSYHEVARLQEPGYPAPLIIYKKNVGASLPDPLEIDVAQLKHTAPVGEIFGENTVGQTFVSREANLNGIEVMLATYDRKNTKLVIFHLRESPQSSVDIFREEIAASDVTDNAWHSFRFPPLEDSKGKSYYFYLESPESRLGNAITAWMSSTNAYDGGALMRNHQPDEGDLAFRTYYVPE